MSFDTSNEDHEVNIEDILLRISRQLAVLLMHIEETTGEKFTFDDLDE